MLAQLPLAIWAWPLTETFSTSPLKGIQRNLTGSKISTSSTKFVFFGSIGKTKWPPWPLIGWDIFNFSSETAEQLESNETWQEARPLRPLPSLFFSDRSENKMAALASDWLKHFQILFWKRWTEFESIGKSRSSPSLASDWVWQFRLLLCNSWTEFNKTWQEARSQRPLQCWCFSDRLEKQDGRPGLWLRHFFTSPLKALKGIQRNLTGSKISTSFTKFVFFGSIGKTRWPPWPLIGWYIFYFSLETLNRIQWNLTGSKISTSSTKFVFFGPIGKQDGRPGLWLAKTFSTSPLKTLNVIQQKKTGSKISTFSTKFVLFGPIGKTRWSPWPLIDCYWHFRLLLWKRSTEFNETWQEARPLRPLPSLRFSGQLVKQDDRPGLWLAETFSTSETARQNSTKLDRKQNLNVLYQVCAFRADWKNEMAALASDWLRHFRLLLWNDWTEFNETWQEARSQRPLPSLSFSGRAENKMAALASDLLRHFQPFLWKRSTEFNSSETAERNSTKLDRKQDLYVLYQVCVFRVNRKNKIAALASDWLRHFILLLWNGWTEFNETWQEARSQRPLQCWCFSSRLEKQDGRPGLWLRHFSTSPLVLTEFNETWH